MLTFHDAMHIVTSDIFSDGNSLLGPIKRSMVNAVKNNTHHTFCIPMFFTCTLMYSCMLITWFDERVANLSLSLFRARE